MVTFKTLKIANFKSIKTAELDYTAGVWKVVGINNDATFKSNGSGKTTILEAIQQCLFNKTTSPTPIDDTSRKTVGVKTQGRSGYKLELSFTKDSVEYKIINDRAAMRIQIFVDDKDLMIKSIPSALKYISTTIGMDFTTFVTLTFINHDTIVELLDNFSSSSLMKVILNFSQINDFEKNAKLEQKVLNNDITNTANQIQTVQDSLDVLGQFTEIDVSPMHMQKVRLLQSQTDLDESLLAGVEEKDAAVREDKDEVDKQIKLHKDTWHKYSSSKCECCGTLLELSDDEREKLHIKAMHLEDVIEERRLAHAFLIADASRHRETYNKAYSEVGQELRTVEQNIIVAQTKNQMYNDSKDKADELRKSLYELQSRYKSDTLSLTVVQTALLVIKSGDIQKDLLETFVAILNVHLQHFIEFVSLDYITIEAEASKANVSFVLHDDRFNHKISIHTLSGGEKTRLRLVVLLSMLQTIKELADTSTNIIVFDESLDTLDASATGDLANLFDYLVHQDNKFIALVSHGDQLKDIEFTGVLTAEKSDGLTKIRMEHV